MQKVLHETCEQYVTRRLSEGWRIAGRWRHLVILSPPDGNFLRVVDLRNDVETLRPNAAGDETALYPSSGAGDNYAMVDEVDPDDPGTYVRNHITSSNVYQRDLYNLPASSGSGTINFIKIYIRVTRYTADDKAKPSLKSNSTVTDGTEIALESGYTNYSQQWDTNPADSQPWGSDWSVIDALQIGVSLKSTNAEASYKCAKCTQVYVEVDYSAGVAHEKTLTESLGLVDKVVKAPSVVKSELLGLLDSYARTWAIYRVYPEILGLSDTVVKTPALIKMESLGLVDTVKKDTAKVLAESLGLLDIYSRTWTIYRTYSELLGLLDSIQKDVTLHPLTEPLGLLDTVVKSTSITRSELLGLKDLIVKDASVIKAELLGLTDTLTKDIALHPLTETLGLLDSVVKSTSITRIESLGLDDRVSKHVSLHALTEVLGLLDLITYSKNPTILAKLIRKFIQLESIGGGGE